MEEKMKSPRGKLIFVVLATVIFLCSSQSFAETNDDGWKFTIGPNFWLAGIDGDATIKGRDVDFDVDFSDIIDNADGGLMMRMELQKGKFGFFLQPNYLKLSADGKAERVKADIDVEFWMVEFGGFYELNKWGDNMPTTLEALVGARYWDLSTDVKLKAKVSGVKRKLDSDHDLIDPFIGLRLGTNFTEVLALSLWGNIGGFDISSDTPQFSWEAAGKLDYRISKRFTIFAGYRAVGIDIDKDDLGLTFYGPLVGFATHW